MTDTTTTPHLADALDVARIALPLIVYFLLTFGLGRALEMSNARTTTPAFTAAGDNFEPAIAVAIGTFGVTSGQALAGVVGPLIEVPALVALVYVAQWLGRRVLPERAHELPPDQGVVPSDRQTLRVVRLRAQRRSLPDGGWLPVPPVPRRGRGPIRGLDAG